MPSATTLRESVPCSQPGPSPTISTAKPPEIKNWNNQTWLLEQLLLDRPRSPFFEVAQKLANGLS